MFGSQNVKKPIEIKAGPVFDPKTIPVHTMQDDLDSSSGKLKVFSSSSADKKALNPFSENNVPVNTSVPQAPSSSPFKENPVAPIFPGKVVENKIPMGPTNGAINITRESIGSNNFGKTAGIPTGLPTNTPLVLSEKGPKATHIGKLAGILAGILVFLGALGGGYYFYATRYNTPELVLEVPPMESISEVIPEKVPLVVPEKFSADKPNYLLIDVEKMTAEDIQKLFLQKAVEIKEDKKTVPIEFVVTDINNNPIAFKIFALLLKVTFPPRLLENFQDEFSVYIFPEGEGARIGLNILPKDAAKALADMKNEEKLLAKDLVPLFLGEVTKSQAPSFQDSQYGNTAIRYINLNESKNLSIDYFLSQNRLIVAMNWTLAKAIIDKVASVRQ